MRLRVGDHGQRAGLQIERREAVAQRDHHAARTSRHDRSDRLADVDRPVSPGCGIEDVDRATGDIHPVENLFAGIPDRAFAQKGPRVEDQFGMHGV